MSEARAGRWEEVARARCAPLGRSESAALDLALRQPGRALPRGARAEPRPLRFVNSLGLGKEPSIEPCAGRLARSRGCALQARRGGDLGAALVDEVAATGRGRHDRLQGPLRLASRGSRARCACSTTGSIAPSPDAYLEDPHDLPEICRSASATTSTRVSYDSPIRSARRHRRDAARGARRERQAVANRQRARAAGGLRAAAGARERPMYGGGMGELGVGRGQIELLAASSIPTPPTTSRPSAYNHDDPAGELPAARWNPSPAPERPFAGRRDLLGARCRPSSRGWGVDPWRGQRRCKTWTKKLRVG
jgi:hypothetical protein